MSLRLLYFLLLPLTFLTACNPGEQSPAVILPADTWFSITIEDVPLQVQLAISPGEQQKGLMYRDTLMENGGMVFSYKKPQQMSFWMANTRIPLDIGIFNGEGLLLEIHRLVPFDTRAVKSRSRTAQFAIETNPGWYAANGLFPGSKIHMQSLVEALEARGANPAEYGITQS